MASSIMRNTISCVFFFFFFNDTATTEIYTLSLHDALPICRAGLCRARLTDRRPVGCRRRACHERSEEHTSELQSQSNLVCRLLLEKKKKIQAKRLNSSHGTYIQPRSSITMHDTSCVRVHSQ